MAYSVTPVTYEYNPAYYAGYGRAGSGFQSPQPFFHPVAQDPITLAPGTNNWSGNQWGQGPRQFEPPDVPSMSETLIPLAVDVGASYAGSLAGDYAEKMRAPTGIWEMKAPDGSIIDYNPRQPFTVPKGRGYFNEGAKFDPLFNAASGEGGMGFLESSVMAPYEGAVQLGTEAVSPLTTAIDAIKNIGKSPVPVTKQLLDQNVPSKDVTRWKPPPMSKLTGVRPIWNTPEGASTIDQLTTNLTHGGIHQGLVSGFGAGAGSALSDIIGGRDVNWKRAGTKFADVGLGSALGRAVSGSGLWGGVAGAVAGMLRVICTELNSQGLLTDNELRAEQWYTIKKIHPLVIRGYHIWAVPYVQLMQKSKRFSAFTNWWAGARAKEILYQCNKRDKPHYGGKLARLIIEPFCFAVGCVAWVFDVPELEWRNA